MIKIVMTYEDVTNGAKIFSIARNALRDTPYFDMCNNGIDIIDPIALIEESLTDTTFSQDQGLTEAWVKIKDFYNQGIANGGGPKTEKTLTIDHNPTTKSVVITIGKDSTGERDNLTISMGISPEGFLEPEEPLAEDKFDVEKPEVAQPTVEEELDKVNAEIDATLKAVDKVKETPVETVADPIETTLASYESAGEPKFVGETDHPILDKESVDEPVVDKAALEIKPAPEDLAFKVYKPEEIPDDYKVYTESTVEKEEDVEEPSEA